MAVFNSYVANYQRENPINSHKIPLNLIKSHKASVSSLKGSQGHRMVSRPNFKVGCPLNLKHGAMFFFNWMNMYSCKTWWTYDHMCILRTPLQQTAYFTWAWRYTLHVLYFLCLADFCGCHGHVCLREDTWMMQGQEIVCLEHFGESSGFCDWSWKIPLIIAKSRIHLLVKSQFGYADVSRMIYSHVEFQKSNFKIALHSLNYSILVIKIWNHHAENICPIPSLPTG